MTKYEEAMLTILANSAGINALLVNILAESGNFNESEQNGIKDALKTALTENNEALKKAMEK